MEPKLTKINKNEVLLYLGYKGSPIPKELNEEIDSCIRLIKDEAHPRLIYKVVDKEEAKLLQGKDVSLLLNDSLKVVFFGATLGMETENLLKKTQIKDMTRAMILDAAASSAVENLLDNFQEDIKALYPNMYLTDRFSPGYGDLPFSSQKDFFLILDLERKTGIHLTSSNLMIPQKSVTGLMGLSPNPQTLRFKGCSYCSNFNNCTFRKENRSCDKA